MHLTVRTVLTLAVLALMTDGTRLLGQETGLAREVLIGHGELSRVDPDAMRFAIKAGEDPERLFSFTLETKIADDPARVADLTTMIGKYVTVEYKTEGRVPIATRVSAQSRPSAPGNLRIVPR
jgi:hypothetical protein